MNLGNKILGNFVSIVLVSPSRVDVISGSELKGIDDSYGSVSRGG